MEGCLTEEKARDLLRDRSLGLQLRVILTVHRIVEFELRLNLVGDARLGLERYTAIR